MQRLLFYGLIILTVILLLCILDFIVYRLLRLFLAKHTAQQVNAYVSIVTLTVIAIASWWGHSHTRLQVMVNQVEVSSPRVTEAFDGYRIAQVSDMHLNSFDREEGRLFLNRLADSIQAQHPDIIVFTGDLVTIRAAEAYPFREELHRIAHLPHHSGEGTIPVFSILGNHDYADYVHDFTPERRAQDTDSLKRLQTEAGWKMLNNQACLLHSQDSSQHIALVGVENIGEPPFSVYGDLKAALSGVGGEATVDSTFTILLSHNPTHWRREVLPDTGIDLMLCGHTHATQVLIGKWSPAQWKYDEWMGLYTDKTKDRQHPQYLYVNTGIGCVGPNVRIGIAPELSILTLRRQ